MAGFLSTIFMFIGLLTSWISGPLNESKNLPWLESLLLEYPLLSNPEFSFVVEVRFKIIKKIQSSKEIADGNILKTQHISDRKAQISRMKVDFEQVIELMNKSIPLQKRFMKVYPAWRTSRDFTVKVLEKISEAMDFQRRDFRFSRIVGTLTSGIGGGLTLFSGSKDVSFFKLIGSIMIGMGIVTSGGTELAEVLLFKQNVEKAKEIVKKDCENLELILEWLKLTDELYNGLNNIMKTDVYLLTTAKEIADVSKENLDGKMKENAVGKILNSINFPPELAEEIADGLGILVSTSMMLDHYRLYFDLVSKTHNYVQQLELLMSLFESPLSSMISASVEIKSDFTVTQKRMITVGMLTEGIEIRQVAKALKLEADVFKVLYDKMRALETRAPGSL